MSKRTLLVSKQDELRRTNDRLLNAFLHPDTAQALGKKRSELEEEITKLEKEISELAQVELNKSLNKSFEL